MLKKPILISGIWSYISIFVQGILSILLVFIFSRFINLSDYGYFTAQMVTISLLTKLSQLEVGTYMIKEDKINQKVLFNGFLIVFLSSTSIIICFNLLSQFLIKSNNILFVDPIFILLTSIILSNNLYVFFSSILLRSLSNKTLTYINVIPNFIALILSIISLNYFSGLTSLIIFFISRSWIKLLTIYFFLDIKPIIFLDKKIIKSILRFGAPLTARNTIDILNKEAPKIFCGFYLGTYQLGILSALFLVIRPLSQLFGSSIFIFWIPILSKVKRDAKVRFGEIFLKLRNFKLTISIPILILIITFNKNILSIFLPNNYEELSIYLPLICIFGVFRELQDIFYPTYVVLDKTKAQLIISLIKLVLGCILFFIFANINLRSIIICSIFLEIASVFVSKYFVSRSIKVNLVNQIFTLKNIIISNILLLFSSYLFVFYLEKSESNFFLILAFFLSILIYIFTIKALDKKVFFEYMELLNLVFKKKKISFNFFRNIK